MRYNCEVISNAVPAARKQENLNEENRNHFSACEGAYQNLFSIRYKPDLPTGSIVTSPFAADG
jgi:hypothetical protein